MPDKISSADELVIAGKHIDQYRDPLYKPDIYYLEALRREPDYLPALKALGEYYTRTMKYEEALFYLDKAWKSECRYNQNPEDGTVGYMRGLCLKHLGRLNEAYDALYRASWSNNVISPAMTAIAAIDGMRKDYVAMSDHASKAIEKEMRHPLAISYKALAMWKCGGVTCAEGLCLQALSLDPLNHLARFTLAIVTGKGKKAFYDVLESNPAQTVLDVCSDLMNAGFFEECVSLLSGALTLAPNNAMLRYTLAYCYDVLGEADKAIKQRGAAAKEKIVDVFPSRSEEITVLEAALKANEKDGFAAYLLGCIRYNSQMYKEAAELWELSVKHMPKFYIPYRNLALAHFNHFGNTEKALELMKKAVECHPKDATLLSELATVMLKSKSSFEENAEFLRKNMPDNPNDQIQLTLARAYNAARRFDKAEDVMRSHIFSPGEGAEFATAEPYMYACFGRGRIAMKEGRYEDALEAFKASQNLPKNLNVGFWNDSVMMPYRYYEAAALKALGRVDEAEQIIAKLSKMKDVGMWNMGGEFVYYSAMAVRLGGEEMRAQRIMRKAILSWEKELEEGCLYHKVIGNLYNCFVGNGQTNRLAALYGMLGYGKLYNGEIEAAKELFAKSLSYDRSPKIAFELELLTQ